MLKSSFSSVRLVTYRNINQHFLIEFKVQLGKMIGMKWSVVEE
ncbi:WSSV002 [White spot syndrome virus]|uniref:WSSV002 n=1 Tax=White spot syndrome virus TaxID=342409 RepID=A0A2I6SBE7_9VIRU|nr:WSSV002 [White spot syndrome virus]